MPKVSPNGKRPQKDQLYEQGSLQGGYFTIEQARDAGFSRQLLRHMQQKGELRRPMRGIYRWTYFPPLEEEEFILLWLWSRQKGVFSHETSLFLHTLSDVLPSNIHMTVPKSWSKRRLRHPANLILHYADLVEGETSWFGVVKVTKPLRTLSDCQQVNLQTQWFQQAVEEGLKRGLFSKEELQENNLIPG